MAIEALNLGADRYLQKGGDPRSQYGVLSQAIVQEVEHHEARRKLRESEKKYRAITEKSHDAIFIYRGQELLFVNEGACELTGYSKEKLYEINVWDLVHPKDVDRLRRIDEEGKKGGVVPTAYEARIITKEEETRYGDFRVTPIEYEGELAVLGTVRDVTNQKKIEEKLKESREEYKSLAENISDILLRIDPRGNFTYLSRNVEDETGYSPDELMGENIKKILTPKSCKKAMKRIGKWQIGEESLLPYEISILTKDGRKRPYELTTKPIFEDEQLEAIQIVARNISERKEAERKLRESETKYRTVFENTGTATCIIEEDTTISLVNRRFEELSGYEKGEIEDKMSWTDFVTDEYLQKMKGYHEKRREKKDGAPNQYEFDFVDRAGNIKRILLTVDTIPESKKSVASLLDVTDIKKQ